MFLLIYFANLLLTLSPANGSAIKPVDNGTVAANSKPNPNYDADHTVLSGVAIDWGHGWGWGASAWTAGHAGCAHGAVGAVGAAAAINSALYCHSVEDYGLSGYDEVDWSAFGDFSF